MYFFRLAVAVLSGSLLVSACQSTSPSETAGTQDRPAPTKLTGRQLATAYCGSCHLAPDPSLLDKATWQKGVLPRMALRMGQSDKQMAELTNYSDADELRRIVAANIFPERPTLAPTDWQKIVAYYSTEAPGALPPQPAHTSVLPTLPLFTAHPSNRTIDALVTLLTYDSLSRRIWAGDARGNLFAFDHRLLPVDSLRAGSPVVDLRSNRDGSLDLLTVGVLNPNDRLAGSWNQVTKGSKALMPQIQGLGRPVQASPADLNRDGRQDVVLCQFGHYVGKLSWFERLPNGYREHTLDAVPGARMTLVRDVNHDGWPDIVALLTQGDEQIAVYYNQRNGAFRKQTILRFPSVYGSSYFELTDIDRDGDEDLLYTNGDNADYSIILKPYHGLRIFRNDGKFHFRQAWFYPMHGASQTVVRDFDQDGDADVAAIAQFPDFSQRPNQGFVYFENQGNLRFIPRTFPMANRGRWLRMDAGDVDQDGDEDLLLGSFFRPAGPEQADLMNYWRQPGAGLMLLENQLK